MIRIYNTLARDKQEFVPIQPGKVGLYVCGMTTYDYCHIGHARMMMAFDVIQRWFRFRGFDVTYVRNITDVDDKIIRRAVESNRTIGELTQFFIEAMNEDTAKLGIAPPDIEPKATEHINDMIGMISALEEKRLAYAASSGDVNFSVRDFPGYGKLSNKSLDQLRAGERVTLDESKRDPLDFVLWKHAKPDEPVEAVWQSPWGAGRPGWHIECSAMATEILGAPFDIHGGGADLQFPHHENEIAQSEGASGKTFARYWLHNGFVNVDDEKMSKSIGNFFTIRDVLNQYDAEVVRFFLLRAHYRSPISYSNQHLEEARSALTRLYTALKSVETTDEAPLDLQEPHAVAFCEAMDDDFNTPIAVSQLFELASDINRTGSASAARQLKRLGSILGLLKRDPVEFLHQGSEAAMGVQAIEAAIEQRRLAKQSKDFAQADRIRAELAAQGVLLEDGSGNTTWRRA